MMKKIYRIGLLPMILLLCLITCASVRASETEYVTDSAELFSEDEISSIDAAIQNLKSETDMDYMVVTTNDAEGKTTQEYADDTYEAFGLGTHGNYSGMLYLIDMDNREIYISTEGDMIRYLTDMRLDSILDNAYEEISNGNYAQSALTVLEDAGAYIEKGIPDGQYNYSSETGDVDPYSPQKGFPVLAPVVGAILGLIAALATFFTVKRRYHLTSETYHYPLYEKSQLHLTASKDQLVNQFITQRQIPKNPPSSESGRSSHGRTTTHRSSSGRVHSGGGRKF